MNLGTDALYKVNLGSRGGEGSQTDLSSTDSHSPRTNRRVRDWFGSLSRSSDRRHVFGLRKSRSVETSDVGQRIGAMGVQVLPPAVAADKLPSALQVSQTNLSETPKLKKSGSGSKIFDKLRRS